MIFLNDNMQVDWKSRLVLRKLGVSLLLGVIGCLVYLNLRTVEYGSDATVLFRDGSEAKVAGGELLLREVVGSRELNELDPEREMLVLSHSYSLFHAAVLRTRAHASCYVRTWHGRRHFDRDAPVRLHYFSKKISLPARFRVTEYDDRGFVVEGSGWERRGRWGEPVVTPEGDSLVFARGWRGDVPEWRTLHFRIDDPYQTALTFMRGLSYRQAGSSNVAQIRLLSRHPGLSARFLTTLLDTYVERHIATYEMLLDSTRTLLDRRIRMTATELAGMEEREWGYKERRRAANLSVQEQQQVNDLIGVEMRREELQGLEKQLTMILNEISGSDGLPQALPLLPMTNQLGINNDIAVYNRERDLLGRLLGQSSADHPRIETLRKELSDRYRTIRSRVDDLRYAVICEGQVLGRRHEMREQELRSIATTQSGVASLVRERRVKGTLYSYLSYKREENDLLRTQVLPPIRVINEAGRGGRVSVASWRALACGVLVALGAWLAWVLVPAFFDFKVRDARMVRRLVTVPVLAEVPEIGRVDEEMMRRDGFAALTYHTVRELEATARASSMLCVTSSTPGEGKTFLSVNLARSLAALGKRVCIVGLDLRRPVMQTHFGLKGHRGVSDFLSAPDGARLGLDEVLCGMPGTDSLTVLPGGTIPPNPAELLQGARFGEMLALLKERFDIVVLDTPPAEVVTDTVLVSQYVDLSLYLVRAGYTDRRLLGMIDELRGSGRLREVRVVVNSAS